MLHISRFASVTLNFLAGPPTQTLLAKFAMLPKSPYSGTLATPMSLDISILKQTNSNKYTAKKQLIQNKITWQCTNTYNLRCPRNISSLELISNMSRELQLSRYHVIQLYIYTFSNYCSLRIVQLIAISLIWHYFKHYVHKTADFLSLQCFQTFSNTLFKFT